MSDWVTLDGEPVDEAALPELDVLADEAGLDIGLTPAIPVEQADPDAAGPWTAPRRPAALWAFLDHYDEIMAQFTHGADPREIVGWIRCRTGFNVSEIMKCYTTRTAPHHKAKLQELQSALSKAKISKWVNKARTAGPRVTSR